jgi:glucose-1-phosphate thymidylyltransferase
MFEDNIVKGVILAGGKGTRLYPLTKVINKPLIPVGQEPMICHPIRQLVSAGIREILIVASDQNVGDITNLLGSGIDFGCELTYRVQEEALGIANALALAEGFSSGKRIAVLLSDNIFERAIRTYVNNFREQKDCARVLLKSVKDPGRFGVAEIDDHRILSIEEKPSQPKSNYAVLGAYFYDSQVFDIIRSISISERGEYEITSVNNEYIKRGQLKYDIIQGEWTDAGTFESWTEANQMLLKNDYRILEL